MVEISHTLFQSNRKFWQVIPGIAICVVIALLAQVLQYLEVLAFGRAWIEALVLAILLGIVWGSVAPPSARFAPGIVFSGKTVLEIAIVMLGATISAGAIAASGPAMIVGIAGLVVVAIALSYGVGRLLRLGHHSAMLVACGNSICGNSAIAAVAPVIGATAEQIASAIAFTAVLGVAMVLLLPVAVPLLGLSNGQYGVLAGLTVYAVPQVLAATAPVSALSVQLGTLVKLIRVLMLGPVIVTIALLSRSSQSLRTPVQHLVPWFIVGFLTLLLLRSLNLVPLPLADSLTGISGWLTTVAMAALGLSVDARSVGRAGGRVIAAATLSLTLLGALAYGLIRLLQLG